MNKVTKVWLLVALSMVLSISTFADDNTETVKKGENSITITLEVKDSKISTSSKPSPIDGKSWIALKPGGRDGNGKSYVCNENIGCNTEAMKVGYMQGYPGGLFKPNKTLTRAEFAVIMYRAFKFNTTGTTRIYNDCVNHWASTEIHALSSHGILEGVNSYEFRPNDSVTKGQVLIILDRILNLYDYSDEFDGEYVNKYYNSDGIARVLNSGLYTKEVDKSYDPSAPISRAEMIHLVNNVLYERESTNADNEDILKNYSVYPDLTGTSNEYKNDCIRALNNTILKQVVR